MYPGNVRILPYKELGALCRSKLYISGPAGWTGVGRGLIESVGGKSWVLDYAISHSDRAPRSTRSAHNTTQDKTKKIGSDVTSGQWRDHQMLSTRSCHLELLVTKSVTRVDGRSALCQHTNRAQLYTSCVEISRQSSPVALHTVVVTRGVDTRQRNRDQSCNTNYGTQHHYY